jgi:hypothetical protein
VWKEKILSEDEVYKAINSPLKDEVKNKLFGERFRYVKEYFNEIEN